MPAPTTKTGRPSLQNPGAGASAGTASSSPLCETDRTELAAAAAATAAADSSTPVAVDRLAVVVAVAAAAAAAVATTETLFSEVVGCPKSRPEAPVRKANAATADTIFMVGTKDEEEEEVEKEKAAVPRASCIRLRTVRTIAEKRMIDAPRMQQTSAELGSRFNTQDSVREDRCVYTIKLGYAWTQ
mmetsp:Transcript_22125/g.48364  ORF Transcript_22125/g.48364 Transcript_22125/m.48364 type:complete len:186 (-) Transcript_22125:24-581(-)